MTRQVYKTKFDAIEIGEWFQENNALYRRISEHNALTTMGVRVTFNLSDTVWAFGGLMANVLQFPSSPTLDEAQDDPRCMACGFLFHSHGKYSQICPVLVRGMLHQFRKAETR